MAWHIFEKLMEGVASYSTFIGKIWITLLFMFRLIIVASIGDTVYSDEQDAFTCNTVEPGCPNVCFNKFSPISHIRFWAVQILFVGTPSILFIVYSMHKITTIPPQGDEEKQVEERNQRLSDSVSEDREAPIRSSKKRYYKKPSGKHGKTSSLPHYDEVILTNRMWSTSDIMKATKYDGKAEAISKYKDYIFNKEADGTISLIKKNGNEKDKKDVVKKKENKVKRKKIYNNESVTEVVKTTGMVYAYVVHVLLRTGIEAGFLYLQYHLFKWEVPEVYKCKEILCRNTVDCFVSRPMEKTLFLKFMYLMALISMVLNVAEIALLIYKWIRRCLEKRNTGHDQSKHILPAGQIVIHRQRDGRAVVQNTYPDLGPFPRKHDNSFGESSENDSMNSDYRFYDI